jgi:hypothetical protein
MPLRTDLLDFINLQLYISYTDATNNGQTLRRHASTTGRDGRMHAATTHNVTGENISQLSQSYLTDYYQLPTVSRHKMTENCLHQLIIFPHSR